MEINIKNIIERHQKYPEGTEILIESYAFAEYKKAISDLMTFAKIVHVEDADTTLIVISDNNYKQWKDLELSHWYLNKDIHQ